MELKLFPKESFDKGSITTMNQLIKIAEVLLSKWEIVPPKAIEFYDSIKLFANRILPQVKEYGLSEEQSREFINTSLNSGSYGTFNIKDNVIIEMNFNPYFKTFYPSIQFLRLLIHESLHLFLYSKLDREIYKDKFKFQGEKYLGEKIILQLDEGFVQVLTEIILEDFDFEKIKELPIYSEINKPPKFRKNVGGLNLVKFNQKFDDLYEKNSKRGYKLIKEKIKDFKEVDKSKIIKELVEFIKEEINKLPKHK